MTCLEGYAIAFALFASLCFYGAADRFKCGSPTLSRCFCGRAKYEGRPRYVTNCTDTKFSNADMLAEIPEETEVLIFTGNNIPQLPWNIFGETDLSMLRIVDMSNNNISEIKGKTFHRVSNVERLILNHNRLKISSDGEDNLHHPRVLSSFTNLQELHLTNTFADNTDDSLASDLHDIFVYSNLSQLYKIHLEQNEIRSFKDRDVFCALPNLHDIYLGTNFIPVLNFNVECIKMLRFLDLEQNNITKFTSEELNELDKLAQRNTTFVVNLIDNPLTCGEAKEFYQWMQTTPVTVRNKELMTCRKTNRQVKHILSLKSFVEGKHSRVSRAVTILVIILSLIILSIVGVYGYLGKERIRAKLRPVLQIISRKVHYTTIDSQSDV